MLRSFKTFFSRLFSNVHHKYRLVVMNESFQEKFAFRLSRLNAFVALGMTVVILIGGTIALIAFTPLKELIPGYTNPRIEQLAYANSAKLDSLEKALIQRDLYIEAMRLALSGESAKLVVEAIKDTSLNYQELKPNASETELAIRDKVESSETYTLRYEPSSHSQSQELFFVPMEGTLIRDFDPSIGHLGIDLTGRKNEAIKAILKGIVIQSEWTPDDGYVLSIEHGNNVISVYKHNSIVLKRVGDYVKSGEPIAFIGNQGEGFKGPILHFELWINGSATNPRQIIPF